MMTLLKVNPHPGQAEVHASPARFKILACGRRWGKTRLGVNECLDVASHGGRAWWIAPSYKMSEVGWRPLRKISTALGAEVRKGDRQIVLPCGGEITVRSADDPNSLRGEGLDFVVLDEVAFMREEVWTDAIRPALSDKLGKAMFISTPKGRNWFWRLWQRGLEPGGEWQSWQRPTADNPYIKASEIEAARLQLPELTFEQEYLAIFLENAGSVFRNLTACMSDDIQLADAHARHRIVIGTDWGKQADFTAISVGCADCRVELAHDRFNKIDYEFQRARLGQLASAWSAGLILAESNAMGEPIIERIARDGLHVVGFATTAQTKPPLIENLALTFERADWRFISDPIWTGELEAYERQVSPVTSRSQYSAPAGMHDDTVIARALMIWAARNISPALDKQPEHKSAWQPDEVTDGESRWRRY